MKESMRKKNFGDFLKETPRAFSKGGLGGAREPGLGRAGSVSLSFKPCFLKARSAFSLVEMLIAMVVTAILSMAIVAALWTILGLFAQHRDYIVGREEAELVAQAIGREITNAGLGMPNNRQGKGSFARAFTGALIMEQMGAADQDWGGPVAISSKNLSSAYSPVPMVTALTTIGGRSCYQGAELYYAWGAPTGVKAAVDGAENAANRLNNKKASKETFNLNITSGGSGVNVLKNTFKIVADKPKDPLSWILFPTSRIPMLIKNIGSNNLTVEVAPGSDGLRAPFMGMDEIFIPRMSRIYLNDRRQVIQASFGCDPLGNLMVSDSVIGQGIDGLHFAYDPELRILSMYIAAQGGESLRPAPTAKWPASAPPLPHSDHYTVVNRVDWRIRN